eukprot:1900067-Rhodomonas_salina.3
MFLVAVHSVAAQHPVPWPDAEGHYGKEWCRCLDQGQVLHPRRPRQARGRPSYSQHTVRERATMSQQQQQQQQQPQVGDRRGAAVPRDQLHGPGVHRQGHQPGDASSLLLGHTCAGALGLRLEHSEVL